MNRVKVVIAKIVITVSVGAIVTWRVWLFLEAYLQALQNIPAV